MFKPDPQIKSFRLHKGKTSIKQIGLILIVALFFIGLVWLWGWGVNREIEKSEPKNVNLANSDKTEEKVVTPEITQSKEGALPEGFPDIPLNERKESLTAYTLNYKTGNQEQKVIDFTSSKSVKENFDFYKDWAVENKWSVANEIKNEKESRLILEKEKKYFTITIQSDMDGGSKVNMSF